MFVVLLCFGFCELWIAILVLRMPLLVTLQKGDWILLLRLPEQIWQSFPFFFFFVLLITVLVSPTGSILPPVNKCKPVSNTPIQSRFGVDPDGPEDKFIGGA